MGLVAPGHGPILTWLVAAGLSLVVIAVVVSDPGRLLTLCGILHLMAALGVAAFARDPDRPVPRQAAVVVAPADGRVMFVVRERATGRRPTNAEFETNDLVHDAVTGPWWPEPLEAPTSFSTEQRWEAVPSGEEASDDVWHLATFMSPLDVHVNRAPLRSTVAQVELRMGPGRRRGPHVRASRKDSAWNERVRWVLHSDDGTAIEVTQIAGSMARTIVPWVLEGAPLCKGQRFGFIRLGSRVDVRLPANRFSPHPTLIEDTHLSAGTSPIFVDGDADDEAE